MSYRNLSLLLSLALVSFALGGCSFVYDFGQYSTDGEGMDAGPRPDGAIADGGPATSCARDFDCDDGVACTVDRCADGECQNTADDSLCDEAPDGVCDGRNGCQYGPCSSATCTAGPCQTAACEEDVCVREPLCASDESCCGDACVPRGCDDGIECTVDRCDEEGCVSEPDDSLCDDDNPCTTGRCDPEFGCVFENNEAPCDDGIFCNGTDTCSGGTCSVHSGDPCPGASRCEEDPGRCEGCTGASDCPDPIEGSWGACGGFSGTCGESGTQSRTVTTFACVAGTCQSESASESRSCTRVTEDNSCGTESCPSWGSCTFSNTCATSGTQSRTCTQRRCQSGSCADVPVVRTQSCTRSNTNGNECGSLSCPSTWSTCLYRDDCATSGLQTRTCTQPVCSGGSCSGSESVEEERSCGSRVTNGNECGSATCDLCSCSGSQTCQQPVCSSGTCGPGTTSTTQPCLTGPGAACFDVFTGANGVCCSGSCCAGATMCGQPCLAVE